MTDNLPRRIRDMARRHGVDLDAELPAQPDAPTHTCPRCDHSWRDRAPVVAAQPESMLPSYHRLKDRATAGQLSFHLDVQPAPAPGGQLMLPGLGGRDHQAFPGWLLHIWDQTRSAGADKKRGFLALRLWVAALVQTPRALRTGHPERYVVEARELIRWLWPNGWGGPGRDLPKLQKALATVDSLKVHVAGHIVWPVKVHVMPKTPDGLVGFIVWIPGIDNAQYGARLDWERLCQYGVQSAAVYRAYIASRAIIDRTAKGKGRYVVRPGDKLAGAVPAFTLPELVRVAGYKRDHWEARDRALAAFRTLEDDGIIELEEGRDGKFRIWGTKV